MWMTVVMPEIIRVGVVNFLNAAPMVDGISAVEGIEIVSKVPNS